MESEDLEEEALWVEFEAKSEVTVLQVPSWELICMTEPPHCLEWFAIGAEEADGLNIIKIL